MKSNFDIAVEHVLSIEKGYVNHPLDKGGPTNYGITIDTLANYRKKAITIDDVKNLFIEEAKAIYKLKYWDDLNLDSISSLLVSMILFDQAVNKGTSAAKKLIQSTLKVDADGIIGPKTMEALKNNTNDSIKARQFALDLVLNSQIGYARIIQNNPSQIVFLAGWMNRTHELLRLIFENKYV